MSKHASAQSIQRFTASSFLIGACSSSTSSMPTRNLITGSACRPCWSKGDTVLSLRMADPRPHPFHVHNHTATRCHDVLRQRSECDACCRVRCHGPAPVFHFIPTPPAFDGWPHWRHRPIFCHVSRSRATARTAASRLRAKVAQNFRCGGRGLARSDKMSFRDMRATPFGRRPRDRVCDQQQGVQRSAQPICAWTKEHKQ